MSKFIVAVTGGIASGKTTVTDRFASKGIDVIDADIIARDVVQPGQPALEKIRQHFGDHVILADGHLDRAALRKLVFADPANKAWLNALLHPLIRAEMLNQCRLARSTYCILAVPLLFENKLQHMVDRIAVVDVDESIQIKRAMSRDGSDEQTIRQIIASQVSRQCRLAGADDVIDNSAELSSVYSQVDDLHQQYMSLSK